VGILVAPVCGIGYGDGDIGGGIGIVEPGRRCWNIMKYVLVLILVSVGVVNSTRGELVTNTFVGEVTILRVGPDNSGHLAVNSDGPALGGAFAGLSAGSSVSLSFVYDSLAGPTWSDPSGASEYGMVYWSIIAGAGHISDTGDFDSILIYDNSNLLGDGPMDLFGLTIQSGYWAAVEFQDKGMDALNSTAIPNVFESGHWDNQIFDFDADGWFELQGSTLAGAEENTEHPIAYFRIDALYSSVPEPSALVLIGTALATSLLVKRRITRL
jgi:hypothetical protein